MTPQMAITDTESADGRNFVRCDDGHILSEKLYVPARFCRHYQIVLTSKDCYTGGYFNFKV